MTQESILTLAVTLFAGNGLVQYLIAYFLNRQDKKRAKQDLIVETLSFNSYCNLRQEGNSLIEKEYATEAERRFLYKMYENYKKHGWNGDMDSMMKHVDNLPYEPPTKN